MFNEILVFSRKNFFFSKFWTSLSFSREWEMMIRALKILLSLSLSLSFIYLGGGERGGEGKGKGKRKR